MEKQKVIGNIAQAPKFFFLFFSSHLFSSCPIYNKSQKSLTSFALSFSLSLVYLSIYCMAHFFNLHTLSCLFALWPHPFFILTKLLLMDKDMMLDPLNLFTFLALYKKFHFFLYEFIITIFF